MRTGGKSFCKIRTGAEQPTFSWAFSMVFQDSKRPFTACIRKPTSSAVLSTRCVNTFPKIRVKDKAEFLGDLKEVYSAPCYEDAVRQFHAVELKWLRQYPRELASWRADLPVLLTFYKYPQDIWQAIYTTNAIERTVKEIRKRLYPMNSVPNIDAAEKIAYLVASDYNERWSKRIIRGFGMETTKDAFEKMYRERYGE